MKRVTFVSLLSLMVLILCGSCMPPGVTVPEGAENLEPCKVVKKVPVRDLTTRPELKGCDPEGVTVVFPDGTEMVSEAVGVSSGHESARQPEAYYALTNWGVPGLVAVVVTNGQLRAWGSDAAIKLHAEAIFRFGKLSG